MAEQLDQVIADMRAEADLLRRAGHTGQGDHLATFAARVTEATEDYRTFLSEADARLFSGLTSETLRKRFPAWHEQGHARLNAKGKREYRQLVLPRRPDVAAARAAGRRGSQEDAA